MTVHQSIFLLLKLSGLSRLSNQLSPGCLWSLLPGIAGSSQQNLNLLSADQGHCYWPEDSLEISRSLLLVWRLTVMLRMKITTSVSTDLESFRFNL